MSKTFFIDTTLCTACRGCQVACKQWHGQPGEQTKNLGTFENPPDLSVNTYKVVRMKEEVIDGRLRWLFFPEQCRHCAEPPCKDTAGDEKAIYKDKETGAVIFTDETKHLGNIDDVMASCPYNIPRKGADNRLAKCDMCLDRVTVGQKPACVQTCPTGAMSFGDRQDMLTLAKTRLDALKPAFPKATLIDVDIVQVIYLTLYEPSLYHKSAMASYSPSHMTRMMALRKMVRPFTQMASRMMM